MVSTGAMRVCEVRCCSSRMRRCCWCRMPARPASSSLSPKPRSRASVDSSISARVSDCTSLYWSISSESKSGLALTTLSLWRAGDAADVHGVLELEQALLDGAVLFDELARMAGGRFQFLVELADLDGELAHHAHQVVEQLGGHARHRFCLCARGRGGRGHGRDSASAGVSSACWRSGANSLVVARRIEHFDDGERVVGRGVFTGDRGHHLLEAVGGGHQRAARASMKAANSSVSQISRMSSRRCASLATPRMPRIFAEPLSVCAARLALRRSSDCVGSAIQP